MCISPHRIRFPIQKNPSLAVIICDFFQKTEKLGFTTIFSLWRIIKIRFMKNFQNKKFQNFFVLILEVSEHILNHKEFHKKFFAKNFHFGFCSIFEISNDFTNIFSVF